MTTQAKRTRYNYDLLIQCRDRDNAVLDVSLYNKNTKLTGTDIIQGKCKCGSLFKQTFVCCYTKGGMYCKECIKINMLEKAKATYIKNLGTDHPSRAKQVREKTKATCLKKYNTEYATQTKEMKEKSKATCLEKYNTEYAFQAKEVKEKSKETWLQNYGTDHPCKSEEIKEKMKATCLEKYNTEYATQSDEVKEKMKKSNMTDEVKEKRKINCIEKYNTEYIFQAKEFKEKSKETCLKKYNTEYASQSEEVKSKTKDTWLQNYGTDHPCKSEEVKEKIKATLLERYRVNHIMQVPEVQEKANNSRFSRKDFSMPSGEIRNVQGYEPSALEILLQTYNEDDIVTGSTNVPEIWYMYENEQKRHFVDIYIKSTNTCIEVKSTWTYEKEKEKVLAKQQGSKELGFNYEIWIMSPKGDIIEKIL